MKYLILFLTLLLGPDLLFCEDSSSNFAILHANVITMQDENVLKNYTVLIQDGRIVEVAPANQVKIPESSIKIDATGKYLIPGLIDAHAHVDDPVDLKLYIAYGVTTIQTLGGGDPAVSNSWSKELEQNKRVGPTYIHCDSVAELLNTPQDARAFVKKVKDGGMKCIKIYSPPDWTKEAYVALLDEAKQLGIRTVGHLPRNLDLETSLDSGLQSIAHAEEYLYTYFNKLENKRNPDDIPYVVKLTRENHISVIPNLIAYHKIGLQSGEQLQELMKDEALRFMPQTVRESWFPPHNRYRKRFTEEDAKRLLSNHTFLQKMTLQMHQAGITLALGTDSSRYMPFVLPGTSAHQELEEFVNAGLTPYDALKAGTSDGAKAVGASEIGQIKKGMRADLVLLNANPLENVRNIRQQTGVMVRGQWYDQKSITKMLDEHLQYLSKYNEFVASVLQAGVDGTLDKTKLAYQQTGLQLSESHLNMLGYHHLTDRNDLAGATSLFRMNVELFPDSSNAYDSLAEAYMKAEKNDLAVQFYKKSLQLNKNNSNAEAMLKKLQSKSK